MTSDLFDPFGTDTIPDTGKTSVLAEDLTIDGDVRSSQAVTVLGRVQGSVSSARLSVGESGRIEGEVQARDLVVMGQIVGSVSARSVTLNSGSVVRADVVHEQIAIKEGAIFEGALQRHRPKAIVAAQGASAGGKEPGSNLVE